MASRRGHKGIAAYLAEVDLTARVSSLTVEQNPVDCVDEVASGTGLIDEKELSIKGSLAAIRKSARAAALIQASFRSRSFRQRQWKSSRNGGTEASIDLVALGSLSRVEKMSCYDDYLHSAAISIQQKYRGWKGRKEFLKIRNRIVKVQVSSIFHSGWFLQSKGVFVELCCSPLICRLVLEDIKFIVSIRSLFGQ